MECKKSTISPHALLFHAFRSKSKIGLYVCIGGLYDLERARARPAKNDSETILVGCKSMEVNGSGGAVARPAIVNNKQIFDCRCTCSLYP